MTDTPGMVWGYWKARNTPALPRTSMSQPVMSSPRNRMRPCVTSYSGVAEQGVGQGRLARPVGPHQGVDLAGPHGQVDAPQDLAASPGWPSGPTPGRAGPRSGTGEWRTWTQCIRTTRIGEIPVRLAAGRPIRSLRWPSGNASGQPGDTGGGGLVLPLRAAPRRRHRPGAPARLYVADRRLLSRCALRVNGGAPATRSTTCSTTRPPPPSCAGRRPAAAVRRGPSWSGIARSASACGTTSTCATWATSPPTSRSRSSWAPTWPGRLGAGRRVDVDEVEPAAAGPARCCWSGAGHPRGSAAGSRLARGRRRAAAPALGGDHPRPQRPVGHADGGPRSSRAPSSSPPGDPRGHPQRVGPRLARWQRGVPSVTSDHPPLVAAVRRSARDLGALQVLDPEYPGGRWWRGRRGTWRLHGRDALLTAWMSLIVDPELALGTLETLARFQGADVDERTEEEPGRILHRLRFGPGGVRAPAPRRHLRLGRRHAPVRHAAGRAARWGLAPEVVDRLLPHADRALEWITDLRRPGRRRLRRVPAGHRPGPAPPGVEGLGVAGPLPRRQRGPGAAGPGRGPGLRTPPTWRGPTSPPRRATPPRPSGGEAGAGAARRRSTATSGSTAPAGSRWRSTATSGRCPSAGLQRRPLPVDRHRRRGQGRRAGQAPAVRRPVLGLGRAHAGASMGGYDPLGPAHGGGVAHDNAAVRGRPGPLRVRGRGPPAGAGPARRRPGRRRAAERAVRVRPGGPAGARCGSPTTA